MPLNKSDKKLFELLALRRKQSNNPNKSFNELSIKEIRGTGELYREFNGKAADVSYIDLKISSRDNYQIPIRIYNSLLPENSPTLIFYPGNAFVNEIFDLNAVACSRIAKFSGIKVIIIDHRLTPENHLSICKNDAYDATKEIIEKADRYKINKDKIFLGGISSGALLASVVSHLLTKENIQISGNILVNGVYSLSDSEKPYADFEKEDQLCSHDFLRMLAKRFYGISDEECKLPCYSPMYQENFQGFPATTIIVSEYDGMRSQSELYYQLLIKAGVKATHCLIPGQTHANLLMRDAIEANEDPAILIAATIQEYLQNYTDLNQMHYTQNAETHSEYNLDSAMYLVYRDYPNLIKMHLYNELPKKFCRVLDFGCGYGLSAQITTKILQSDGYAVELVSVDINNENLKLAKERLPHASLHLIKHEQQLDFLGQFDLIICNFVLVENPTNKMSEILTKLNGLLNDRGVLIVTNCASSTYKKENTWSTLDNKFPANEPNSIKFKEDQAVWLKIYTNFSKENNFTFFDYFHSGSAYRQAYKQSGFKLLTTHKPIGHLSDNTWSKLVDEKTHSPYKIHVLKLERRLQQENKATVVNIKK